MNCIECYCHFRIIDRHTCKCPTCVMRLDYKGACSCNHIREGIERVIDPKADYTLSDICSDYRTLRSIDCPSYEEDWVAVICNK